MKTTTIMCVTSLAVLFTITACQQESTPEETKPVTLDSIEDKVSYVIGYTTAQQVGAEGFALDAEVIAAAVRDLNEGRQPMLSPEEMEAAMVSFQTQIEEQRQTAFAEMSEENRTAGEAFLEENGKREGVKTTPSGLQYETLVEGVGASPAPSDEVSVNYIGTLINGEVFDEGQAVRFQVDQLIPAWVEALPQMKVGGKWKLYVPSDLAYGPGGTGNIGPNETLIFDMELLDIITDKTEAQGD